MSCTSSYYEITPAGEKQYYDILQILTSGKEVKDPQLTGLYKQLILLGPLMAYNKSPLKMDSYPYIDLDSLKKHGYIRQLTQQEVCIAALTGRVQ